MKMIKTALSLTLFCLISTLSFSQTTLSKAFSSSYTYESNKEYSKAISALSPHYSKSSYEVNLRIGWLHYLKGDYTKSQTYYKTAMTLKPKSVEAILGYIYPAAALQNWEDVIKKYKAVLALDNNNYTANYRLGEIYYYRKDFSQALTYVTKVRKSFPFDYSANLLAGKILIGLGKIVDAKAALNSALLYDPTSKEVTGLLQKL